ncbi:Uncharacterized protein OS=Isosphaera pallida (strain ATCC 43644 / DSM 9630 / IS1B) GN=Isop_1744 PE=4 SV=1 [Gemmata massiliana]|uniref:Uncharacterized protein n=1 Tax=Gemmata massiliana TaxID=1210884 RepID=A0A6P2CRT4_9BACT|nr:hypothetical protein [Gemmata massiliana]VTR90785.1 Uncharacterized protein OS=Isosphaera pallida (strain ATCC 43644 / DSM 9630 / IS1B) GN=Isop_1744 PE=4 SV=1 [Gemmata massiliana]
MLRVLGAVAAFLVCLHTNAAPPVANQAEVSADKAQAIDGKVVPLADALKKLGVKADTDTVGVALVTADGTVYTLVKDEKTRLLFLDPQLHNRDVRLTAKVLPGTRVLHVERVQTVKNGKAFNVDYWCEQCQLDATEPGPCKCCGGETALRELPAK